MHENRSYREKRLRIMNCEIVLDIVRAYQPIAKRDVARQSGLHVCTVGVIVEQLTREGMLRGELVRTSRGRPPIMISIGEKCDLSVLDLKSE
jgi:predicted transcriptional regulator